MLFRKKPKKERVKEPTSSKRQVSDSVKTILYKNGFDSKETFYPAMEALEAGAQVQDILKAGKGRNIFDMAMREKEIREHEELAERTAKSRTVARVMGDLSRTRIRKSK